MNNKYWYFDIELYKAGTLHIERIDDELDKTFLAKNPNLRYYCGPTICGYPFYDKEKEIIRDCETDREKVECGFVEIPDGMFIDTDGSFRRKDSIKKPNELLNYTLDEEKMLWVLDENLEALRHKLVNNLYDLHVEYANKKRLNQDMDYSIFTEDYFEHIEYNINIYKTLIMDIDEELEEKK